MLETQVRSLSQEDPLEKEKAIHSSTLAWKIPQRKFLVEKTHQALVPGAAESDTTERLHFHFQYILKEQKMCVNVWAIQALCLVLTKHFTMNIVDYFL